MMLEKKETDKCIFKAVIAKKNFISMERALLESNKMSTVPTVFVS